MSTWLDPLRRALDEAPAPAEFFFRDDDVGWRDDRLFRLLDLFAEHAAPIDLAVIPSALTARLAGALRDRVDASRGGIELHQHGFAHVNHEAEGRKCEFGAARAKDLQRRDIAVGWGRLVDLVGPCVRPIFTPPWNRCSVATGECLVELGFGAISRDATAAPLEISGLAEIPVRVDWFGRRKGVRLDRVTWGARLAAEVGAARPIGIMLHHAEMDAGERAALGELLAVIGGNDRARLRTMLAS
jgi:peptidoglycan/xylan/chitin deacetylase (PgdA/CDA1 family)